MVPLPPLRYYARASTASEMQLDCMISNPEPCRGRANYAADSGRANTNNCKKTTGRSNTLSPGWFTLFCQHGFAHGFRLMDTPESPKTAFDFLMCYLRKMPRIVIYDNACNLHNYVLRREPRRFKHTRFLIDRLHAPGHRCSLGYGMDTSKADDVVLNINSMSSDIAIQHRRVFLGLRN